MQDKHAAAAPRPTLAAIPAAAAAPVRDFGNALIVVLLLVRVPVLYLPTTLSMAAIWERSETFAHGYVVFPIFLYLLWRERDALAGIERKPYLPALLGQHSPLLLPKRRLGSSTHDRPRLEEFGGCCN